MANKTSELVSSYKASGLSRKEYCVKHGIASSTLDYHLRKSEKQKHSVGTFLPIKIRKSNTATKTVVLLHGAISTTEIAELIKRLS